MEKPAHYIYCLSYENKVLKCDQCESTVLELSIFIIVYEIVAPSNISNELHW